MFPTAEFLSADKWFNTTTWHTCKCRCGIVRLKIENGRYEGLLIEIKTKLKIPKE